MKTRPLLFTSLAIFASTLLAPADTFLMKDGSKIEGKVLREEGDTYVLEVNVTASIKDERRVPKADVELIQKERADVKDFEAIEKLVPTPDLLTSDQYDERIMAVNAFLKKHPTSPKKAEAKKILETLKEESVPVSQGAIKIDGEIVEGDLYKANAYEIDARILEAKIRAAAANNNIVGALRLYSGMEKDYSSTKPFQEVLPLVQTILKTYQKHTEASVAGLPARLKEREAGLARMSPDDRSNTIEALKEEEAALNARFAQEKAAQRDGWVTLHPFHQESHRETLRVIQTKLRSLSLSKPDSLDGGEAYREAWESIKEGGDEKAVNAALAKAKAARVSERYLEQLKDAAKVAEVESQ